MEQPASQEEHSNSLPAVTHSRSSASSCADDTAVATVALELEHAQKQIECLTAELDRLRENTAMDQKHYQSLLMEFEEAKLALEEVPTLKEELECAYHTIDERTEELERVKFELGAIKDTGGMGVNSESLARELGEEGECLSLEDEMRQVGAMNLQQELVSPRLASQ